MLQSVVAANPRVLAACVCPLQEKSFAFIELRSVEETSNALSLDGVAFKDGHLKVGRKRHQRLYALNLMALSLPA